MVNSSDPGDLVCSEVILLLCVKINKVNYFRNAMLNITYSVKKAKIGNIMTKTFMNEVTKHFPVEAEDFCIKVFHEENRTEHT